MTALRHGTDRTFSQARILSLLMLIPLWIGNAPETKRRRSAIYFAAMAWAAIMGISRLFCGAHYLTDVCCGFLLGFAVVELTYKYYGKTFSDEEPVPSSDPSPETAEPADVTEEKSEEIKAPVSD